MDFIFGIVIFLLIIAMVAIVTIRQNKSITYMEAADKLYSRADHTKSLKTMNSTISDFERLRDMAVAHSGDRARPFYDEDLRELKDMRSALEQDQYETRADRILQDFMDSFYVLTDSRELESFNDVEELFKEKMRCIRLLTRFYEIDTSVYTTKIDPHAYIHAYMGSYYDPCVDNPQSLEARLSAYTDPFEPVLKCKRNLCSQIVKRVRDNGSVKRSALLKGMLKDYDETQIRSCYRYLINHNRIVEQKIGSRIVVSLPGRKPELNVSERTEKPSPAARMLTAEEIRSMVRDNCSEYVDMTSKGGALYFFDNNIADQLKSKGCVVGYASKGTRSTSWRPAWYIRL